MSTVALPNEPSIERLRRQAKELRDAVRAGEDRALSLVSEHHPSGVPDQPARAKFSLASAQLVVARRYGFASWPRLKHHLDVVAQFTRTPGRIQVGANAVDEFLRLGCLTYADDRPERWTDARQLLLEQPEITEHSIHAAAAANHTERVERLLRADPTLARVDGGPFAWTPLLYLAYSRVDPNVPVDAVLTIARLLLDAGADPNAGYLWRGTYPFTALTGAF